MMNRSFALFLVIVQLFLAFRVDIGICFSRIKLRIHSLPKITPFCMSTGSKYNFNKLKKKLSDTGQAGLLAYGSLNFLYYTISTIIAVRLTNFDISTKSFSTKKDRIYYAALQLSKVSVVVWAGSQVTKGLRLILSVLLSPLAERGLRRVKNSFSLQNENQAFWILVSGILVSSLTFYVCLILFASYLL